MMRKPITLLAILLSVAVVRGDGDGLPDLDGIVQGARFDYRELGEANVTEKELRAGKAGALRLMVSKRKRDIIKAENLYSRWSLQRDAAKARLTTLGVTPQPDGTVEELGEYRANKAADSALNGEIATLQSKLNDNMATREKYLASLTGGQRSKFQSEIDSVIAEQRKRLADLQAKLKKVAEGDSKKNDQIREAKNSFAEAAAAMKRISEKKKDLEADRASWSSMAGQ